MKIIDNIEIVSEINNIDYLSSIELMETKVSKIQLSKANELIWFLNYDHMYTVGASGNENELKHLTEIPFYKTNRGGKITYHGPGQRIIYFIINLNKRKKDIRKFVNLIENSAIKILRDFDIEARTFYDRVGIWVTKNKKIKLKKEEKIGAIGLRIKKWVTYHGLSFNLNTNLKFYNDIDACGLKNYSSTSLKKLGVNLTQEEFDKIYLKEFLRGLKKL